MLRVGAQGAILKADGNLRSHERVVVVSIDGDRITVEDGDFELHETSADNIRFE